MKTDDLKIIKENAEKYRKEVLEGNHSNEKKITKLEERCNYLQEQIFTLKNNYVDLLSFQAEFIEKIMKSIKEYQERI